MHYKTLRRLTASLLMCLVGMVAMAQSLTVSGVVNDATGQPVPGAAVIVVGTTTGTVTDFDGLYTLQDVPSDGQLQVSFVGFATQTKPVGGQTKVDFVLKDDAQELQEVVAVGYGTMKKSDLTGSIASVSTEKLVAKGATSVMENLQGSVPGVSITQSTGRTNGGFDIEIRGKSSINSDTKPIYVIDGVVCSDMDFLNPQDIERLDVLKDASSTAIYGSRATAGVIMITTKSGTGVNKKKNSECAQKFNVSYDGYVGVSKVVREADFMTAQQFYNYRFLRFLNYASTGARPTYRLTTSNLEQGLLYDAPGGSSVLLRMMENGETVDWVDLITRNGLKQNHYISASGSTSDISYHFGLGYTDDKGLYEGDRMCRYNFKGSLDTDMGEHVVAGFNFNAAVTKNEYANDDAVQEAMRMNPFMRAYDEAGDILQNPGNKTSLGTAANQFTDQTNPLCYMENQTHERMTYRLLGNAYLQIKPIKGLSIKSTYSPSFTYYRDGQFDDTLYGIQDTNSAETTTSKSWGWTWTNVINWNKTFGSNHSVDITGINEWNKSTTEKTNLIYTGVMDGTLWHNLNSGTYDASNSDGTSYSENSMLSFALRANYSFAGKYMVTGTVRWDASSKFDEDSRWGTFPSAALAWRLSEESFMENTRDVLSNLKVRFSYGVTGNNAGVSNYATMQTPEGPVYTASGTETLQGFHPSSVVDKQISWETSKELNLGADFGFLNNRISGNVDFYKKTSEDLLYNVQLPLETGGQKMYTNIGEVVNKGVELAVTGVIIDNDDWHWELTATWAKNKNEVKEINGSGTDLVSDGLFIGKTVNNIYTYTWDGIVTDRDMKVPDTQIARDKGLTPGTTMKAYDYYYQAYGWSEGMPIYRDVDGNGKIDEKDKSVRSSDPNWTGSLSTTVSWKGIDLSASLYTKQGYEVSSATYERYLDYSDRGRNRLNMDFYIPAGALVDCGGIASNGLYENATYQQETHYGKYPFPNDSESGKGVGNTDAWKGASKVVDASFVKVKNITLGYTLPKNVLDVIHLQKARIYCTVTNPFCWTKDDDFMGWDPEWVNASLKNDGPAAITWEFGLNLKF